MKAALKKLDKLMRETQANGILKVDGKIIASYEYAGPVNQQFEVQSVTKSINSLVLGIALTQGKIVSLDDKVKEYYPALDVGPYTAEITFRHLASMTAGIGSLYTQFQRSYAVVKPWTEHHYHNDQCSALSMALTYIFGRSIKDVANEAVFSFLEVDMGWDQDRYGPSNVSLADGSNVPVCAGYAFSYWTPAALARLGELFLANGQWQGMQLLCKEFIKACFSPVPFEVEEYFLDERYKKCYPTEKEKSARTELLKNLQYGLNWWHHKDYPAIWCMSGTGGQLCMINQKNNTVLTKLNPYQGKDRTFLYWPEFLKSFNAL